VLENELRSNYPNLAENYVVCSDTIGSIYTALPKGGMVVIAGTGSNAHLKNPDGTAFNCGGWGHFLGDEGSAFGIAHRAMKIVFDAKDNLEAPPFNTDRVWSIMRDHFSVKTRLDLLDYCYAKFEKSFFSMLCLKLAKAAHEGDELCLKIFSDAGRSIAKSIIALLPNLHSDLIEDGVCTIVCVGSVWLSYDLLKSGFCKELDSHKIDFDLRLIQLTQSMALGAVYLAADDTEVILPRDYTKNYSIFYTYSKNVSNVKLVNGGIANRITNGAANHGITNGLENGTPNGLGRA
jgi:N-acetylglucosamine kinase